MLAVGYLVLFSVAFASFSQDPRLFVGFGWLDWGWHPDEAELATIELLAKFYPILKGKPLYNQN